MSASSNIRAFVQWKEPTVFAGEEVSCTVTFKNIAPVPARERSPANEPRPNGSLPAGSHGSKGALQRLNGRPPLSRNPSSSSQKPPSHFRGHRPSLSLNVAAGSKNGRAQAQFSQSPSVPSTRPSHGRSLSIISLGNDGQDEKGVTPSTAGPHRRPSRGHTRSASLQVVPGAGIGSPLAGQSGSRSVTQPSPRPSNAATPIISEGQVENAPPSQPSRRSPALQSAASSQGSSRHSRRPSASLSQGFKFPMAPPPRNNPSPASTPASESAMSPRTVPIPFGSRTPHVAEEQPATPETLRPEARLLSGSSTQGTPRSSGEFYSVSNHSTETLASEYAPQLSSRLLPRSFLPRRTAAQMGPSVRGPETLMMGYAHVAGTFSLDGSLVNQAPFEEVKRKGVVGGQGGGGVVGVERTKREVGLFGALGWGTIGESLGSLLNSGEPSSIGEMRGIANAKTVPLISTPQSILFVDLRLGPGESKSYNFSFTLPRGLPPTHKGRAIKISYRLIIGTQRPGFTSDQQVKQVDIPFRVVGSVNTRGEILGHDLMSPYIMLKDLARTSSLSDPSTAPGKPTAKPDPKPQASDGSSEDFLTYVNKLLDRPSPSSALGLLSPTDTSLRRTSYIEEPKTMKEAIDLAILRSNMTNSSNQSANRFEIARSGRRVAVVSLTRPAYRLGEVVAGVIDLAGADIPCYAVEGALESAEKVDPAIALRSAASIHRVTRKVHAALAENALFAARIPFALPVPPHATPEFVTSGVSLEWRLRIEFVTPPVRAEDLEEGGGAGLKAELLEETARDDRGLTLVAVEELPCESFEVAVPIRVYGAVLSGVGESADVEGLKV